MAVAGAGLLAYAARNRKVRGGIKLGNFFTDKPTEDDLAMLRHAGVDAVSIWTIDREQQSAEWMIQTKRSWRPTGCEVYNIGMLDLHCDPTLVLSLPGVEQKIEQYKTYLNNLGRAGIHYTTYAHMSNIKNQPTPGFYQTSVGKTRGERRHTRVRSGGGEQDCRARSTRSTRKSRSGNRSRRSFAP